MTILKTLLGISALALFAGCTTIQSHSGGSTGVSGQRIRVETTKYSILNLQSMDESELSPFRVSFELRKQCPEGKVVDMETILWKRDWFLFQSYNIDATGTCAK